MVSLEYLLLIGSILLLVSILTAKALQNVGIPTLLLFIGVGILAGSEGLGGIEFSDASMAQSIGILSLIFILFSGGLDTNWKESKIVSVPAFLMATLGTLITALVIAFFVTVIFKTSFLWGLLIGSIISSTDAAAVFSILRTGNIGLKGTVKPLLELESGSNDPMAVFLTIGTIELIMAPDKSISDLVLFFFLQIGLGLVFGILGGKLIVLFINKLKFFYEGIYSVLLLALVILLYSFTTLLNGSGFLAIYIAGLIMSNQQFIHKKALIGFFDGFAWLGQISMFLTLGLLLFPSELLLVTGSGILLSLILMLVARPLSVFITLIPFKFNLKEKMFISWVGLRGAVPIILATFPLLKGVENSHLIFNLVFFVVLSSATIQGWSINPVAKWLKLSAPLQLKKKLSLEFSSATDSDTDLIELIVPFNSSIAGKQIVDINFPADSRIVLIIRDEKNIVPSGGTVLEEGDILSILINKKNLQAVQKIFM
ncbi:MAG: potassium/proton antiporter [Ignavibacteria bacterium]|nr:potassium/proton antiporter [Ignavibacteria bacterium]